MISNTPLQYSPRFDAIAVIYQEAKAAPYWVDKVKIWFMHPSWRPRGLVPNPTPAEVTPRSIQKYDSLAPQGLVSYAVLHFVLTLIVSVGVMAAKGATLTTLLLPTVYVTMTLVSIGGIFERRGWVLPLEFVRLGLLVLVAGAYSWETGWFIASLIVTGIVASVSIAFAWAKREVLRSSNERRVLAT